MGIALNDFKAKVQDVARPNRFLLTFTSPAGGTDAETMSYLVKAAQIPNRTNGEIILNWQGMQDKIVGDPTFEDFTVTFINDYEYRARTTIEGWLQLIADQNTNERGAPPSYKADALVQQLGRQPGEIIATYKMEGFFPKDIGAIDLGMENNDQAAEFQVNFSVDIWNRA